jgi:hypothetical protein
VSRPKKPRWFHAAFETLQPRRVLAAGIQVPPHQPGAGDPPLVLGDFNRDGVLTADDLPAMMNALVDLDAYKAKYQLSQDQLLAIGDINGDFNPLTGTGGVDNRDLGAMLDLLARATAPQPDPIPPPPPEVIAASIDSAGVLTITGTSSADSISLLQSSGTISISGITGSWTTTQVKSIVIDLGTGNDYVSLDSKANGGTQTLKEATTIYSGGGAEHVHVATGHDVYFRGTGHTLQVALTGSATLDGVAVDWTQSSTPPPDATWFNTNIHDTTIRTVGSQEFQDGLLDRNDIINLLRSVEQVGAVTATQLSDLQLIVNTTGLFGSLTYVQKLSSYIVLGNTANANYQGAALGNLTVGSSADQLEKLVDKWFLGLDRPATGAGYSQVSGQLFASSGPVYTDVHQGSLADCAFLSSLAETAVRSSSTLTSMFIVNGDGTYSVRFYHGGVAEYVTVDSYLPGGGTVYARVVNNVLWVALAEKAYSQAVEMSWFGGSANAYSSIAYLYAYAALGNITGQSTVAFTYTSGSTSQTALANAVSAGKLVCLISYSNAPSVVQNHAYAVLSYDAVAGTVTLFNPWGIEYGLVTLSWADVQANFQYFDRTA